MARPRRPRNDAERQALFEAAQASLTPEQLEAQRKSNKEPSFRRLALSTIYEIKLAKRWFLAFMSNQYPDVDAEAVYLRPGSPFPPLELVKEYLRYLIRSRIGNLGEKLSAVTLTNYLSNFITMRGREVISLDSTTSLRAELRNFIYNNLAVEEGAHTAAYNKQQANSEDLTYLTQRMYEREFVSSFPNMREFLNLNLFMCLMVDCCERGGAIVQGLQSTEDMCLKWEDICFYTHQSEDDREPTFDIAANVTIRWAKGQKLNESEWRTIALPKLLPLSMAPEDTLRLLLILAILDGVIDGVENWSDLGRIRAPPGEAQTGRRIRMVEENTKLPVLRRAKRTHSLTDKPKTLARMTALLRRLRVYTGLEGRLIGYCLRRGVANKLEAKVSKENRRFMMGHRTTSTIYSAYHSRISTIDTARIIRDMPETDEVSRNSSILLNRIDSAPRGLSDEGLARVYADPDVRELEDRVKTLREEILARHPSIISASRAREPLWEEYHKVESERRALLARVRKEEFNREYAAAFQDVGPQAVASPGDVDANEALLVLSQAVGAEDMLVAEDAAGPDEAEEMDEVVDLSAIDPQLWQEAEDLERARDEEMAETAEEEDRESDNEAGEDSDDEKSPGDATGPVDDQVPPEDGVDDTDCPSMRLHQLSDDHFGRTQISGKDGGTQYKRRFRSTSLDLLCVSAYNDLGAELKAAQVSEEEVCRTLLRYFGVIHPTHKFPAGFEPKVGTYDCRFCGKNLEKVAHCWRHVIACSKADAGQRAKSLFDDTMRDKPCTWKTTTAAGVLRECGFGGPREVPLTPAQLYRHVQYHLKAVEPDSCYFGDCASLDQDGELQGVTFDSAEAFQAHIYHTHSVWHGAYSTQPQFCAYCQTWINNNESNAHMSGHLADVQLNVSRFGYTGLEKGEHILISPVCPFHYHDETLPAGERMHMLCVQKLPRHILDSHITSLQKAGSESLVVCPSYPSMCTKASAMNAEQLKHHLIVVHGIEKLAETKPRASSSKRKQEKGDDRQSLQEIEGNSRKKPTQQLEKL